MKTDKDILRILNKPAKELAFVVRVHLAAEYFLGHIITRKIKIKIPENTSCYTKILIVQAANMLPKEIITAMVRLNLLRNKLGHKLEYEITKGDVKSIITPLEKYKYKEDAQVKKIDNKTLSLMGGLCYLVGFLNGKAED